MEGIDLIERAYKLQDCDDVLTERVGNVQLAYRWIGDDLLVGIAGTNDVVDVSQSLMFCGKTRLGPAIIHRGYYKHAMRAYRAVVRYAGNMKVGMLFLYGHSLGGVTAQIVSLILHEREQVGYRRTQMIEHGVMASTYAAPKGFRNYFEIPSTVTWVVKEHTLDIVPNFPLTYWWDAEGMKLTRTKGSGCVFLRRKGPRISYPMKWVGIATRGRLTASGMWKAINENHSLTTYRRLFHGD